MAGKRIASKKRYKRMNRSYLKKYIITFLFISLFVSVHGQNKKKEELEVKKQKSLKEIEYTNKLLEQTRKKQKQSMTQLVLVDKKINLKENVIENINEEIHNMKNEIERLNASIERTEALRKKEIKEYEKFIYSAYKHSDKYEKFMYILSAKDINTIYVRLKYYRYYNEYRQNIVKKIITLGKELETKKQTLNNELERRENLKKINIREKKQLESEKSNRKKIYNSLKSKESELRKKIEQNKKIAQKLELKIQEIINQQVSKEKKKSGKKEIKLTPEEIKLSNSFKKNKGKLPWPTSRGVITGYFGEHEHPILKVKVRNNGIDITTEKNSSVRAIFNGEVKKVIAILGANYTVILRHGNYISVYQNLVNVKVHEGDNVSTKQVLGNVYSGDDDVVIHFEIWDEFEKQNPVDWICNN